jgi:dihydroorotase
MLADADLVIRGARIIDPASRFDGAGAIAVREGRIASVGEIGSVRGGQEIDAGGLIASPGWIDLHAHVFAGSGSGSARVDAEAGVGAGVTTVVDAGSAGAGTWEGLREYVIDRAQTRVLAFLNISIMPSRGPCHGDWANFNQAATIALAEREAAAGRCAGIKVLASQTHCGNLTITPVKLARQAARLSGTRVMAHIGNAPPLIEDVLDLMEPGDIVTHCWHGKPGGLLGRDRRPLPVVRSAVERGVRFDLGHGSASFSFRTARDALEAGLPLHSISTDLHRGNVRGPVFDLATTMSKLLHLGLELRDVVRLVTCGPAESLGRGHELGSLRPGACADITLFRVVEGECLLTDSERLTERAHRRIQIVSVVRGGALVGEPDVSNRLEE